MKGIPRVVIIDPNEKDKEGTFSVHQSDLVPITSGQIPLRWKTEAPSYLERRASGELRGRAVYLPPTFEYKIVLDSERQPCLLVMKRRIKR